MTREIDETRSSRLRPDETCDGIVPGVNPSPSWDEVEIVRYRPGNSRRRERREVIGESPLVIEFGESRYTIMRTPGRDRELSLGFVFSEGLVEGLKDVTEVEACPLKADVIRVVPRAGHDGGPVRNLIVNSACGLCGREGLDALIESLQPCRAAMTVSLDTLYVLPGLVRERQPLFERTGGCHAAALFDSRGHIVVLEEDLGRHNALDKCVGRALFDGLDFTGLGAFLSGRASLEMIVKASRAGIPLVCAVSAPSSAAIDAAERLGITLCGFVRGDEVVVYTHEKRIGDQEPG